MMELPIETIRFKEVRDDLNLTQSAFAELLDISSTTADIERGRTKLSGNVVMKLLRDYKINPLWLFGESPQKFLNPDNTDVSPKMISVDSNGEENIFLVSQKAAAGYAGNIGDPEYYQELPAFSFPLPEYRNASFRGFQIEGYSMMPAVRPGEWVLANAVDSLSDIKDGVVYIVIDESGIRLKKIYNDTERRILTLISLNTEYLPDHMTYAEVKEVWKFHSKISFDLDSKAYSHKLETIHNDILEIKENIKNRS